MSIARERVRATQWLLALALLAKAALWALAVVTSAVGIAALVDLITPVAFTIRELVRPVAISAGAIAAVVVIWRGRRVRSTERVALWIEEHVPWLEYRLVTAIDPAFAEHRSSLEPAVGEAQWGGVLATAAGRALALPGALAGVALVALLLLPDGAIARARAPRPGDVLDRVGLPAREPRDRLTPLVATIVPPGYSGLAARTIDEPSNIAALTGSRVTLRGRGRAAGLDARLGDRALPLRDGENGWELALLMPERPAALRLRDGGLSRLVAFEPMSDSIPRVVLLAPARDSVLRAPTGSVPLAAEASDDLGLASGAFEYIVTSGQGESFTFRTGTVGARSFGGARTGGLAGRVTLDSLGLSPGDVVHLRAVARDRKDVGGPGVGSSETRTFRIARTGEYDSVAVEGAPPPEADTSLLSQRMLIMLTEALERRRPRLGRPAVLRESQDLARDQTRLRRRVGEIVFMRLEGEEGAEHAHAAGDGHEHGADGQDLGRMTAAQLLAAADAATGDDRSAALDFEEGESPVVAINRPLLEAFNHMWDASRELEQGEPARALPPMRRALDALQRARAAERIYLRGRPAPVVVDVARARLQGRDAGSPAPRPPAVPSGAAVSRAARLARAIELLAQGATAGIDSLLMLRVDALGEAPALAAALGEAVTALRAGRDATLPLSRARRTLEGTSTVHDSLPRWGRGW